MGQPREAAGRGPSRCRTRESSRRLAIASEPARSRQARFFEALGFDASHWEALQSVLLDVARSGDASPGQLSPFGTKFEVRSTIRGPAGREAKVMTIWIVNAGDDRPRFVTAYPD